MNNALDAWTADRIGCAPGRLDRAAIEAYQLERLRETLAWAQDRAPFYHAHLAQCRLPTSLDEVRHIPFTTADDLRTDPYRFLCVSQSAVQRAVTLESSGTSGPPKRLFFTAEDVETTLDFFHHGLSLMAGAGDTVLIMLPGTVPDSVGDLLVRAAGRLGATGIVHGFVADPRKAAEDMVWHQPDLVIGIPVQLLAVARAARDAGLPALSAKSVLLCTDYAANGIVRELEQDWHAQVFQDWGMTEMGYGGGVECSHHRGYHLQETDFLFEIVDPATGMAVAPGETGEVVLTTLTRRGMPLIRYRTGDLSRFRADPCPCQSPLRRLDRIAARRCGAFAIGGDREIAIADLDEVLLGAAGLSDFSARLVAGAPRRLKLAAQPAATLDPARFEQQVRGALDRVPAIRAALSCGDLVVDVEALDAPLPFNRAKRSIVIESAP